MIFQHANRYQWHNDDPLYDGKRMLARLQIPYIKQEGYANLRCVWTLGCRVEIHPFSEEGATLPGADASSADAPAGAYYKDTFEYLFPNMPVPEEVGASCCAQFAVTAAKIRERPKRDYERYRRWLVETPLSDGLSGRVMEYSWHSRLASLSDASIGSSSANRIQSSSGKSQCIARTPAHATATCTGFVTLRVKTKVIAGLNTHSLDTPRCQRDGPNTAGTTNGVMLRRCALSKRLTSPPGHLRKRENVRCLPVHVWPDSLPNLSTAPWAMTPAVCQYFLQFTARAMLFSMWFRLPFGTLIRVDGPTRCLGVPIRGVTRRFRKDEFGAQLRGLELSRLGKRWERL